MTRFRDGDRDLLFSVFAIQLGHANADQLAASVGAWSSTPGIPLADQLARLCGMPEATKATLWGLVDAAVSASGGDIDQTLAKVFPGAPRGRERVVSAVLEAAEPAPEQTLSRLGLADTFLRRTDAASSAKVTEESPGRYLRPAQAEVELGRGGLGRVFVRFDQHLGREVAVKELLAAAAAPHENESFVREARITGHLEHPSIIPVHELGRRPDGRLYYTMKWVKGRTLREALAEAKGLPDRLPLLDGFVDVAQALAYAHSRRVIHRDVKPDNVLLGAFGETLLVDWGLAKLQGEEDRGAQALEDSLHAMMADEGTGSKTLPGSAIGSPSYMSPEQARGDLDAIDERSDVWGLGGILFETLTGRPPYQGRRAAEVIGKVLEGPPPRVLELEPSVPPDLAAIADKALAYAPVERYPSAKELAEEVTAYLAGERVGAYAYGSLELARRFVRRNRASTLIALLALVGLVVGSAVTYAAYQREGRARAESEHRERLVHAYLARSYLEKAERLSEDLAYGEAEVHAATALFHHPGSKGSPWRVETSTVFRDEDFRVRALSVLHHIRTQRRLFHACRLPGAKARFWDEGGERVIGYTPNTTTATIWSVPDCTIERTFELPRLEPTPNFYSLQARKGTLTAKSRSRLAVVRAEGAPVVQDIDASDFNRHLILDDPRRIVTMDLVSNAYVFQLRSMPSGDILSASQPVDVGDGSGAVSMMAGDRSVVYATSTTLRTLPLPEFAPQRSVEIEVDGAHVLATSPDVVVLGGFDQVHGYDARSLAPLWQRRDLEGYVIPCGSRDSPTMAAAAGGVHLLDPTTGETLEQVDGEWCLVAPSGAHLLTHGDGFDDVWRVVPPRLSRLAPRSPSRHSVEISADDRWLGTANGDTEGWVDVYDMARGARVLRVEAPGVMPPDLAFSPASTHLAVASGSNELRIYRLGEPPVLLHELTNLPVDRVSFAWRDVQFDGSGRVVAWVTQARPHTLQRFDLERGEPLGDIRLEDYSPNQLRFGLHGRLVVVGGKSGIEIREVESSRRVASLPTEMGRYVIVAIDVSSTGWLAAAGLQGRTWLYNLDDLDDRFVLTAPQLGPQGTVRFSRDGRLLCVGDDTQLAIWDMETRRQRLRIADTGEVCAFTPDGENLIADIGDRGLLRIPLDLEAFDRPADELLDRAEATHPYRLPRH